MFNVNSTHEPALESWIKSANEPGTDFPIQNLPYCVFEKPPGKPSIGVGIGEQILDLRICADAGLLEERFVEVVRQPTLNALMGMPVDAQSEFRRLIMGLLID